MALADDVTELRQRVAALEARPAMTRIQILSVVVILLRELLPSSVPKDLPPEIWARLQARINQELDS